MEQLVPTLSTESILAICVSVCHEIGRSVSAMHDRSGVGNRPGQYALDLVADGPAVRRFVDAGFSVFSEESGHTAAAPNAEPTLEATARRARAALTVVLDPVDGSTNASRGLPWWATSICIVDAEGPWISMVRNQVLGATYHAVRGEGAFRDGTRIAQRNGPRTIDQAILGINGLAPTHLGWQQFRALGSAALEICAVADGQLDGFVDATVDTLAPWDYLGGALILAEAGGHCVDRAGRDLVTWGHTDRRTPVATATAELGDALLAKLAADRWPAPS